MPGIKEFDWIRRRAGECGSESQELQLEVGDGGGGSRVLMGLIRVGYITAPTPAHLLPMAKED